jgi:hypothetical protein
MYHLNSANMYFNDPYKNQTEGVSKPSAEENIWS